MTIMASKSLWRYWK